MVGYFTCRPKRGFNRYTFKVTIRQMYLSKQKGIIEIFQRLGQTCDLWLEQSVKPIYSCGDWLDVF